MDTKRAVTNVRWSVVGIGFLLSILAGSLFAVLLRSVGEWEQGLPWERSLMLAIHSTEVPAWMDSVFLIIPWLGTNITLLPIVVASSAWLWLRRQRADLALQLMIVQLGSWAMNPLVKLLFDRPRPELWEHRGQYAWAAYPSGHAIASVAVLFTIAYLVRRERGWTWPFGVAAALLAISLYSRVYLGVHWPTDVIAGFSMGLIWLASVGAAFARGQRRTPRNDAA